MIALLFALIAAAAGAPSPLGKYELAYPFPSPKGDRLAFQGNFDGRWQLYLMELDDGSIRRLHISAKDDTHPAWSPDGTKLAFISNRDGNDEVYVLDVASGSARSVSPHPGKDGHPKWSSDSLWLVFNRTFDAADKGGDLDSAILRVRFDGSDLSVISDNAHVETFPSFSPDGRSVVFVEWFPNAAGERNRNGELVVVNIATGARRNITRSDAFDGYPYWGPSGDWIYFSTVVTGPKGSEAVGRRISPDGRRTEDLTDIDGRSDARGIPSKDEAIFYFNMSSEGRTLIHRKPLPLRKEQFE